MLSLTMRFLVTAGSTREKIDRVRDWGNIFTGNTGYAIARELSELGQVDLITSNRAHLEEFRNKSRMNGAAFTSHADLKTAIGNAIQKHQYDAAFMTAAIADYRPAGSFQVVRRDAQSDGDGNMGRPRRAGGEGQEQLRAGRILGSCYRMKLVDLFRTTWAYRGLLFKFKLEVDVSAEKLIEIGQASRRSSGADYLVANTLEMVEGESAGAYLLSDAGHEWVRRAELPRKLADVVRTIEDRNPTR